MKEKKLQQIIQILYHANGPMTSASLASALNISKRSVITYIQEINRQFRTCIHSGHSGYVIDRNIALQILNTYQPPQHIPQGSEERVIYILHQLLIKNELDLFDLCDEIFISFSTIQNEIKKLKRKLARFDLWLITSDNKITIQGSEKNKRKLLSSILYEESNANFLDLETIQNIFLNIDITYIQQCICDTLNEFHYFINDYSLINLILHVAITIDRTYHHNMIVQNPNPVLPGSAQSRRLALQIVQKLEGKFHIQFSDYDIDEITLLLEARTTALDYMQSSANDIEAFVGKECMELIRALIYNMENYYSINLSEREFLVRFSLHIKNLLIRTYNNYPSKNPLTEETRMNCPLIYDAAVTQASIIKEYTGLQINEDEIAYIAFHLGSTIETQKRFQNQIKIILYCPTYYNMDARLMKQLDESFSDTILITDILTEEKHLMMLQSKADLLISTVPVNSYVKIPVYRINLFLTEKNIEEIRQLIYRIQKDKHAQLFKQRLSELIRPELFIVKKASMSKERTIHVMVQRLLRYGYANENLEQEILQRESLSSTAFHQVAIPHSMKQNAKKTGICVLINKEAISWSNAKVHLVIMLCFNQNERIR